MKHSVSPTYNHTMVYDGFQSSDLREACAELTVWHRDGLKTDNLGGVRLSCGTGENLYAFISLAVGFRLNQTVASSKGSGIHKGKKKLSFCSWDIVAGLCIAKR